MGQQEGRPPRCILTREINCRGGGGKDGWRRRDGDGERTDGQVTPSQEGREERVKRKTLEKNWQHGERQRKQNKRKNEWETEQ